MIRTIAACALIALAAAPATAAERRYSVTDFDRLIVEGPYQVRLVVGRASSVMVSGSQAGLDRVTVDSQGRMLRIRRNRSAWGGGQGADNAPVVIALSTRSLRSARLVGPGRLEIEGGRGLTLDFGVEGSGSLRVTGVAADNLSLALLGAGRIEIAGTAMRLRADVQGTGELAAAALVTRNAILTTNSAGAVALTVNGPAAITANGLGAVSILGRPACTVEGAGAAQVVCSNQRQHR